MILRTALHRKKIFSQLISKVLLCIACISLISCQDSSTSISETVNSATVESTKEIVIGDISNNPGKKIVRYQPMADYLANNLSEFGIGQGKVKIASNLETMIDWLKSGQVDIYFDSPYPAMIVSDRSGAEPILRRWKSGQGQYYGIFLTMNSNGIRTLDDLQGKIIGFDEPHSTSGYFLPLIKLIKLGFQPIETIFNQENISDEEIGYVFTQDDENTIQWLISGRVDAGVVDLETFDKIPAESRREIKILAKTKTVPRQIVSIRKDIDPKLRTTIETILLNMNKTNRGKQVLTQFEQTTKFDNFPAEQSIQEIRQLYELITKE